MDTIADLLVRISNAKGATHKSLELPYSNLKESVLGVLKHEGFITDYRCDKQARLITVNLDLPRREFMEMNRISRPGRRFYVKAKNIPRPRSGHGIVIVSTPGGVLSGEVARKNRQGGELICEVF